MGTLPMANRTKGAGRGDIRTKVQGGPMDDGTESERGAEQSARGCDGVDWRWPGLTWVSESGAEDMLM